MVNLLGTDEGKEFVKSWSVFIDPTAIFLLDTRFNITSIIFRYAGLSEASIWAAHGKSPEFFRMFNAVSSLFRPSISEAPAGWLVPSLS